jgi:hypothetical protein
MASNGWWLWAMLIKNDAVQSGHGFFCSSEVTNSWIEIGTTRTRPSVVICGDLKLYDVSWFLDVSHYITIYHVRWCLWFGFLVVLIRWLNLNIRLVSKCRKLQCRPCWWRLIFLLLSKQSQIWTSGRACETSPVFTDLIIQFDESELGTSHAPTVFVVTPPFSAEATARGYLEWNHWSAFVQYVNHGQTHQQRTVLLILSFDYAITALNSFDYDDSRVVNSALCFHC